MSSSKIAIIGSGISGLAAANILRNNSHNITVYEKNMQPGGLIRCTVEDGNLFHRVGGHVFNTKIEDVQKWFWNKFEQKEEFLQANRNAKIWMNNTYIGYPIENFLYQLPEETTEIIITELLNLNNEKKTATNFEEFLCNKFGQTLHQLYFNPYNKKIWNYDLSKIPLPWLEEKLPMPELNEIFTNNIQRHTESKMVHSSFYYPKKNGSSFIAERLAQGLNILYNTSINEIEKNNKGWKINGVSYHHIIYTGDVRQLNTILKNTDKELEQLTSKVTQLPSNGTSNVLCYVDDSDLSWLYLPEANTLCHRIIYTGNFSPSNNKGERKTCTVEFTGKVSEKEIRIQLKKLPGNLEPIAFNYEPNSYVIQEHDTRQKINSLKEKLNQLNFHLVGRFAEWEYHNMDKAVYSAMQTCKNI